MEEEQLQIGANNENAVESESKFDPRKKENVGLDFWAEKMLLLFGPEVRDEFIRKNNSKELEMDRLGFPQLKHYGLFNSIEEIKEKIMPKEGERFIIRCSSKENGNIKRLVDTDLDGVCDFAEKLDGGFEKWNVEVKEFVQTKIAGTLIIRPDGGLTIETWYGPHYLNTTNCPKYRADFNPDPPFFDKHINWHNPRAEYATPDISEVQRYALDVLRYVFPHIRPRTNEAIYIEYGIRPDGQIYFIEANDSEFYNR